MSFKDLPLEVHGRIGDFLDLGDRSQLRLADRFTSDVYQYTARASFRIKQRYTFIDLQLNEEVIGKGNVIDISVLRNSSMVGTSQQIRSFLSDITSTSAVYRREMDDAINSFLDDNNNRRFLPTFREFLTTTGRNSTVFNGKEILSILFRDFQKFRLRPINYFYYNVSLFGVEELQELIRHRLRQEARFPVTLVKIEDVNFFDYIKIRHGNPRGVHTYKDVNSIKDLIEFFKDDIGIYDFQLPLINEGLMAYLNAPNEDASIKPLRDELRFRIKHEINVELL
jgi:hypothetical protein